MSDETNQAARRYDELREAIAEDRRRERRYKAACERFANDAAASLMAYVGVPAGRWRLAGDPDGPLAFRPGGFADFRVELDVLHPSADLVIARLGLGVTVRKDGHRFLVAHEGSPAEFPVALGTDGALEAFCASAFGHLKATAAGTFEAFLGASGERLPSRPAAPDRAAGPRGGEGAGG